MKANRTFVLAVFLATCCTMLASTARTATYTWDAGSGEWGTDTNWSPNGVPGTGDVVLLTNGGTVDLGGARTVNRVGATGAGNGIVGTIENGSLHFTGQMYVSSGTLDVNLSNDGGTRRLWIGGDSGSTVTLDGNNSYSYMDGSGAYATLIGHSTTGAAGTVKLGTSSALGVSTNRTHVYSGVLDLNGVSGLQQDRISLLHATDAILANSTGAASTNADIYLGESSWGTPGGNIRVEGGASLALDGIVAGSASNLNKLGAGTLILSGDNTFTGTLNITDGAVRVGTWNNHGDAGPLGQSNNKVQLNGGAIQYTGGNVGPNKSLHMAGPGTVDVVQAGTVLNLGAAGSNSLTGNGDITKEGLGTLQLAQAAVGQWDWGGKLIINAGTVDFFGGGSMPTWSAGTTPDAIQINDGATLALSYGGNSVIPTNGGFQLSGDATIFVNSHTHSYGGVIANKPSETGNLIKSGTGTLILSADNTYSGTTTITAGTLRVGANGTTGTVGDGNIVNNSALVFHRSNAMTIGQDISGSGTLTKEGSGMLTLTGNNAYLGITTISAGTLEVGDGGTTGTLGQGNIVNNATLRMDRSDNVTLSNNISGSGSLVKVGANTLILTGDNTYNGTTTISGTLQIGTGGAAGTIGSGNIINNGALVINRSGDVVLAQDISGSGTLTKEGSGTLTLAGATNYGGSTYINNGNVLGALNFRNDLYIKNGTVNANLSNTGYTSRRVWIGGDAGATVTLGGDNSYTFTDNYATIIGHSTTGAAGTVRLGGNNALGGTDNRTDVYSGTLDLNGQNAVVQNRIRLMSANAAFLINSNTTAEAGTAANVVMEANNSIGGAGNMNLTGVLSGGGNLTKIGTGTLTLSNGANTHTGATIVGAGRLLVNGSTHASSLVTVQSGATLGGTGTVGGATTIQAGGKLATGNSIGTLNFGNSLTLNARAVWDWQFLNNSPGNYDQADGPQLVLPTTGAVTFNIDGRPEHSVFPGDKFTVFTGNVDNFSPERVALVNHSKWTSWEMSTGGSLVLTANPTISLSTDVLNAGQANPGAFNRRPDGYSNMVGVELVRFISNSDADPLNVAYTQAGDNTINVAPWVRSGAARNASQQLQVNGYSTSGSGSGSGGNLYLRGEPNEYNEGFGAHANWIVTFDLDVIREEHFTGTRMPFQLTGEFGAWGGLPAAGHGSYDEDGVIQGAIFLDGVRIDSMDPSIANPVESIRNLEFDLMIHSGRYLTFGIFNEATSTSWDDGVFKNVNLTMIPEPGTWLMLLAGGAAGLLFRRRRKR